MTIAGTNDLKIVLVADLKAYGDLVTALSSDATKIKEAYYQGSKFDYPAIRVEVERLSPINDRQQCNHMRADVSVRAYSEQASSDEAATLAQLLMKRLHRRMLRKDLGDPMFYITLRSTGLIGPRTIRPNLWVAETMFSGTLYDESAWVGADAA